MAKKAFVLGCNHHDLEYARADAERMECTLKQIGFEVHPILAKSTSNSNVLEALKQFLVTCTKEDDFFFYFAGHGISYEKHLFLILDTSKVTETDFGIKTVDMTTALNASTVLDAIEIHCKAKSKLVIIDACHSGAINKHVDLGSRANYEVITAAKSSQKVPEIDALNGGFISIKMEKALLNTIPAATRNLRVTSASLFEWLQDEIQKHNQQYPTRDKKRLPLLTIIGKKQKSFIFKICKEQELPVGLAEEVIKHEHIPSVIKTVREKVSLASRLKRRRLENDIQNIEEQYISFEDDKHLINKEILVESDPVRIKKYYLRITHINEKLKDLELKMEAIEKEL